jgi:S-adenosylmethionine:tRNA ribosyltransferase-isomerase
LWEALVRPSAKLRPGTTVDVGDDLTVEVGDDLGEGRRRVRPSVGGERLLAALGRHGEMPLPPYLGDVELSDPERYQTVFADRPASAAAPTAGLHLTDRVLEAVEAAGAGVARIELVVGLGTFRPIIAERVEDHPMHAERYRIDEATWAAVAEAERVVAVGTTTVRALESAAATGGLAGSTDLYIRPPYPWRVVDLMMTNFHLPRSSLLVMIEAFAGPRWRELYALALAEGYRFLSFGDAMLLDRTGTAS